VTNEGRGLDEAAIGEWCRQLAALMRDGREVVMVSSGAIAEGMKRLGWRTRPREINELQAAAAVGEQIWLKQAEKNPKSCPGHCKRYMTWLVKWKTRCLRVQLYFFFIIGGILSLLREYKSNSMPLRRCWRHG
jgi:hypothetical protein